MVGGRVHGRVRNLTDFGAFVEIEEGVDGLVHISDMSWVRRIKHPSELLKKGQELEVVILNIDAQSQRLSLGLKQLEPDVWEEFFKVHAIGDTVVGKVARLVDFGIFVELQEGVEGFVHVSELATERVEHPRDRVSEGEELTMRILRMDVAERKIGLSVKALFAATAAPDMGGYTPGREGSARHHRRDGGRLRDGDGAQEEAGPKGSGAGGRGLRSPGSQNRGRRRGRAGRSRTAEPRDG